MNVITRDEIFPEGKDHVKSLCPL